MSENSQPKPANSALTRLVLVLLPLATMLVAFVWIASLDPLRSFNNGAPPVEALTVERTILDEEPSRADARPVSAVPARRGFTENLRETRNRPLDLLPLFSLAELEMLDPAPPVAANIMAGSLDRLRRFRLALQRQGAGEDGHRQVALGKQAHDPPEANPAPKLEHRFSSHVAFAHGHGRGKLGQAEIADAIVVSEAVFGSLLKVEDKIDGDARAIRPMGIGRELTVSNYVATVRHLTFLP